MAAATEYDDRPGVVRETLVAGQRELRGALAKAVRLAVEEGHLRSGTDPWQVVFELLGIVLAAHHDRGLLDDRRALDRARAAFDRLIDAHAPRAMETSNERDRQLEPAPLTQSWPLLHAHSLTVRALRPEDADLEARFGLALSAESRYDRFLTGGVKLDEALLRRLVNVDFSRDMALIAVVTSLRGRNAGRHRALCARAR